MVGAGLGCLLGIPSPGARFAMRSMNIRRIASVLLLLGPEMLLGLVQWQSVAIVDMLPLLGRWVLA